MGNAFLETPQRRGDFFKIINTSRRILTISIRLIKLGRETGHTKRQRKKKSNI